MKELLFNVYKVCYLNLYKEDPQSKPDFIGRFGASTGVFLFIGLALLSIYIAIDLILNLSTFKINKPLMWFLMISGDLLVYLLLFKVLGLEDHNYYEPEYKPDEATIKKTWRTFAINLGILLVMLTIKSIVRDE